MTLDDAIKQFGSVREIAQLLSISVQAVYKWGEEVPPLRVYQLRDAIAKQQSEAA
jgi:DNA invertase Pin-like site-specific DNA recombinase